MKEIPWFNQPWTKLKRNGPHSLDDAELLSIILLRGNKDNNILELSNKILTRYNLHQFSNCGIKELKDLLGEDIKVYQVLALGELFKRYGKLKVKGFANTIEDAKDVFNMFHEDLKSKKKEHLFAILLDSKNRVIKKELISVGTLNQSFAHPREVFVKAIKESANSIILVHNHPSGDPMPSKDDINISKKLVRAGNLLGIKVLDHIIIGKDKYWSWMENK